MDETRHALYTLTLLLACCLLSTPLLAQTPTPTPVLASCAKLNRGTGCRAARAVWTPGDCWVVDDQNNSSPQSCPAATSLSCADCVDGTELADSITCDADPWTIGCEVQVSDVNPGQTNRILLRPNASVSGGSSCPTGDGNLYIQDTDDSSAKQYSICTPSGNKLDIPDVAGTVCTTASVCTGYEPSGTYSGVGSCTNQFVRALNDGAAPTCADVDLTADVTGTLPVANGGTGNTSFVAGDVPYFDGAKLAGGDLYDDPNTVGVGVDATSVGGASGLLRIGEGNYSAGTRIVYADPNITGLTGTLGDSDTTLWFDETARQTGALSGGLCGFSAYRFDLAWSAEVGSAGSDTCTIRSLQYNAGYYGDKDGNDRSGVTVEGVQGNALIYGGSPAWALGGDFQAVVSADATDTVTWAIGARGSVVKASGTVTNAADFYGSALATGGNDYCLYCAGDEPVVAQAVAARVYNSANISIANNVLTAVTFDSERSDPFSMHDTSTNTSRITIPTNFAGWYTLTCNVIWDASSSGYRQTSLRLNGTTYIAVARNNAVSATRGASQIATTTYQFSAGDYVECIVYQNSGGALNLLRANAYSPEFSAVFHGK